MDFTVKKYEELLKALIAQNYTFQTFNNYLKSPNSKVVLLRHDVDDLPENSLRFAKIQYELGIKGVYYFRAVPQSWDVKIIKEIASLGHEVGYHYETMDTADGNVDKAPMFMKEDSRTSVCPKLFLESDGQYYIYGQKGGDFKFGNFFFE